MKLRESAGTCNNSGSCLFKKNKKINSQYFMLPTEPDEELSDSQVNVEKPLLLYEVNMYI